MNITSVQTKEFHRPLSISMKTSQGIIEHRSGIILAVSGADDKIGFGEVDFPIYTDGPGYNREVDSIRDMLSATLDAITGLPIPSSLDDITAGLKPLLSTRHPAVYFGVETALCDLAARVVGRPLHQWLHALARSAVPVNYLVPRPVDDWDRMAAFVNEHGYCAVKAKIGGDSLDNDVGFVSKLRETLGNDIAIRLDANRGWDFETAMAVCSRLNEYNIEYIEEPLAAFDTDHMSELSKKAGIRFALDESLVGFENISDVLTLCVRPTLILKPARIGGIARTLSVVKQAKKHECPTVITSNMEIEIGTAALLHVAAAFYDDSPPCGLDTARLFDNPDPALTDVKNGKIEVPDGPGSGLGESLWQSL